MKGIWKVVLVAVAAGILAAGFVGGTTSRVAHADPNSFIFKAYDGACSALPFPRPTALTTVSPNTPYCVEWGTTGALAANETATVSETGRHWRRPYELLLLVRHLRRLHDQRRRYFERPV